MSQFFNGEILIEPQAKTKFEVGVPQKANPLATGRVIVIGESEGGAPNELLWFNSQPEAKAVMRSGDTLRGIGYIFNPSPQQDGAPIVGYVRAQVATKGEYDAGSALFESIDYGLHVNNTMIKVEAGTQADTSKVSVMDGENLETFDNLGLAVSIQYVGADASGLLEITAADHIVGSSGAPASEVVRFDYDFALSSYNTISKVIAAIDELADWDASIYQYAPAGAGTLDSTSLNTLAEGDVKTAALLLKAYPYVAEHAISNGSAFVDLTTEVDGTQLTNTTDFVNLAGGLAPAMTSSDVTAALTLIEEANCQIVWIDSDTAAYHAMVDQANKDANYSRFSVHGGASQATKALSISSAQEATVGINSPYSGYVACGVFDFAEDGNSVELLAPKFFAAKTVGLIAGVTPITPITWNVFSCQGLQYEYTSSERDTLIQSGIITPRFVDGKGFVITQGINTLQNNQNLWDQSIDASPEISLMMASWQLNKEVSVNAALTFIGGTTGVGRGTIVAFIESLLKQKEFDGTLAPNDSDPDNILPAWQNVIATRLDAGWAVQFETRYNTPFNYFLTTTVAV